MYYSFVPSSLGSRGGGVIVVLGVVKGKKVDDGVCLTIAR